MPTGTKNRNGQPGTRPDGAAATGRPAAVPNSPQSAAGVSAAGAVTAAKPAPPPVAYQYDDTGLAFDFRPEDLKTPIVRIIQKGMPPRDPKLAEVPPGRFGLNTTGEDLGDSLHVVVLGVIRARARLLPFDKQGKGRSSILCRSYDGIHGQGDPGGDCESCPFATWQEGDNAPQCTFSFNYFLLPLQVAGEHVSDGELRVGEFATPVMLRLTKLALREARLWNDSIKLRRPQFGIVYRLDVVETVNPHNPGVPLYLPKHSPVHTIRDRAILDTLYGYAQRVGQEGRQSVEAAAEAESYDETRVGGEPEMAGVAQSGGGPAGDSLPF